MSDCCCHASQTSPSEPAGEAAQQPFLANQVELSAATAVPAPQPSPAALDAPADCCCAKYKATPRGQDFQADLQRRLNRAIGQLNGVKAMLDDNRYCGDVLTQLAAAESAVHRVSELILRNHMQTCVVEQIRAGHDEVVDEAMDLIHRFGGR
jgi:CsoR family transcriptional regulator, copper-sensing transcriptional repressor